MFLTMASRSEPEISCEHFYNKNEWKAVYIFLNKKSPPENPPSIKEMNRMVGNLGGFLGRKSDGEPGIKSMWIGIRRLADITSTFSLAQNICG